MYLQIPDHIGLMAAKNSNVQRYSIKTVQNVCLSDSSENLRRNGRLRKITAPDDRRLSLNDLMDVFKTASAVQSCHLTGMR